MPATQRRRDYRAFARVRQIQLCGNEYFFLPSTRIDKYQRVDIACRDDTPYITTAGLPQIWRLNTKPQRIALFTGNQQENIAYGKLSAAALSPPGGLNLFDHWLYVANMEDSGVRLIDLRTGSRKAGTPVETGWFDFGDDNGAFYEYETAARAGVAT